MSVSERKSAARAAAFARRKQAHALHRDAAAQALAGHLNDLTDQVVAGYLPIRTEADPLAAMTTLAVTNRICVPVIAGKGQPLVFHEWTPDCALVEGPFGVMVPRDGAVLLPEVLIVPLVAFDPRLYRLGYGGGFYDRTLEQLRAWRTTRAIGFAYSAQRAEALPLEPTDQPLDELVTETGPVFAVA